jgi:bacteriocin biosynthesis cyclodehydratase domain-containing protein
MSEDFVVSKPTERDRVLLERLGQGYFSEAELIEACEARGIEAEEVGRALADLDSIGLLERSSGESLLSPEERERYDRQLIYFSDLVGANLLAESCQRRLQESTVVVLGTGGLGSWVASGLACAGVGSLVLIDDDRVELSNLNRQILFGEDDVGGLKVEMARRSLLRHNSQLNIRTVDRRVYGPGDLADVLDGVDLLIAVADWPPYDLPRWVNQACVEARVPHISAGQHLPLNRVGPTVIPGESACLECEERAIRQDYPLYDELAEFRTAHPTEAATIGTASGILGSMLAMEAIHLLSGAVTPASIDAVLLFDLRTMVTTREAVERDPECPVCGGVE